jgi:hypothetical protein
MFRYRHCMPHCCLEPCIQISVVFLTVFVHGLATVRFYLHNLYLLEVSSHCPTYTYYTSMITILCYLSRKVHHSYIVLCPGYIFVCFIMKTVHSIRNSPGKTVRIRVGVIFMEFLSAYAGSSIGLGMPSILPVLSRVPNARPRCIPSQVYLCK